jgi:4-amino-4-deoxy-L-arabinose transferase-like glycosyltransferase
VRSDINDSISHAGAVPARPGALDAQFPGVLLLNALIWAIAAWLSRGNLDLSGDMVQDYVWGIEWRAGYSHHPPLFAWVSAAWFSVMPRVDLAYYVLSMLNAAVGLLGVAALARRFLTPDRAAFAALALAVSPLYSNLAIKFNANAILLSIWPWAATFFVAFMQDGRRRNAIACGALVGLSFLGKYFSIVLLCALLLVALALPPWRRRLLSANAALGLAVGAVVLVPHVLWMFEHHFSTLQFAAMRSAGVPLQSLSRLAVYTVAQVGYLLPSLIFLLWSVPGLRRREATALAVRALSRPGTQPELWWLTLAPLFIVAAIAALHGTAMASVWGMAQWFAVTALWLAVWDKHGIAPRVHWLKRALPVYWGMVLAISAAVGYGEARDGSEGASLPRAELAQAALAQWRARTNQPLVRVAGSFAEAMSIAFYAPGKTHWWSLGAPEQSPWVSADDLRRDGSLLVCAEHDGDCQREAAARVAEPPMHLSVRKQAWGLHLPFHAYRLYFLLPSTIP